MVLTFSEEETTTQRGAPLPEVDVFEKLTQNLTSPLQKPSHNEIAYAG